MDKIWYILINNKREGPFSIIELKRDSRLTPDTHVWRDGWTSWQKVRDVPELEELFHDDEEPDLKKLPIKNGITKANQDELVLDMGQQPPYLLWVLLAAIIVLYVVFQLYMT